MFYSRILICHHLFEFYLVCLGEEGREVGTLACHVERMPQKTS